VVVVVVNGNGGGRRRGHVIGAEEKTADKMIPDRSYLLM